MARTRSALRRAQTHSDIDPELETQARIEALLARASPPAAGPRILDEHEEQPWVPVHPRTGEPEDGDGDDGRPSRRQGRGHHDDPAADPPGPSPFTVPTLLRRGITAPGIWAVVGMAIVAVVAAAIFGVRVWRAEAASAPVPLRPSAASTGAPAPTAGGSGGSTMRPSSTAMPLTATASASGGPGSATTAAGTVVVQVAGEVTRPGVVTLPAGSRVVDAVARCGTTRKADLTSVNLARPLSDGEQIVIVATGTRPAAPAPSAATVPGHGGAGGGSSPAARPHSSGAPGSASGPIDLNTADATVLETLPGVGPVLAERILQWRTQHGRFSSVDELGEVAGVGEKTLQRLTPLVTV